MRSLFVLVVNIYTSLTLDRTLVLYDQIWWLDWCIDSLCLDVSIDILFNVLSYRIRAIEIVS